MDDITYWLYMIDGKLWNKLKLHFNINLSFMTDIKSNIRKNDMIIVYVKKSTSVKGFAFSCIVSKNISLNLTNIKIFDNVKYNKFIINIKDLNYYNDKKGIKLNDVKKKTGILDNFNKLYGKSNNKFIRLPDDFGESLAKLLNNCVKDEKPKRTESYESSEEEKPKRKAVKKKIESDESSEEEKPKRKTVKKKIESDESSEEEKPKRKTVKKKIESDESSEEEKPKRKAVKKKIESDESSEEEKPKRKAVKKKTVSDESSEEDSEETSSDKSDSETETKDEEGKIPIMIVPCKKFKPPKVKDPYDDKQTDKFIEYFKDHYIKCTKCDIINNNNQEPSLYFKDATFEYAETNEYDDADDEIEKYQHMSNHDPYPDSDESYFIIKHIKNEDNIYNKCIILQWRINKT
uniref:EVE domain-containing protein n=1 Tax=viral metagenome TaxID=1070528 RepID=A0A6C0E9W6_9ZZZZ